MNNKELWSEYCVWAHRDESQQMPPDVEVTFLLRSIFFRRAVDNSKFDSGRDYFTFEWSSRNRD